MATLNLNEKKIPSAENLRLIAQLCISLANKQSSLEDRCIAPWKADETYQKDISYVSHNGYVYICSVTNQDSVFTESHWSKLSDNFDELTVNDIKAMLNLTSEQLDTLQNLIDDVAITTTKTNSSSKIYTDIQAAIDTAKTYTNNQLGKAVKPAYKVVASTSDVTETGYFYLISNSTNYDMYVLSADGSVVSLGTSDVDLSDFYTKAEIEADFLKKTDAASTYAEITTVDGKVDKTDIVDNLTSTDTDKPLSANQGKVLKDSIPTNKEVLDKLSENDDGELVYNGKVINMSMYISEETSEYNTNPNTNVTLYFTILGNKMTIFLIQRASNDGKTIGIKYPLPFKSLPTITRTFGTPSGTEKTTKNTLTEWSYDQNYGYAKQNELHFMIQGTI